MQRRTIERVKIRVLVIVRRLKSLNLPRKATTMFLKKKIERTNKLNYLLPDKNSYMRLILLPVQKKTFRASKRHKIVILLSEMRRRMESW